MLTSKNTNCDACKDISLILDNIDCAIFDISKNLYNNIAYLLNKKIDAERFQNLLHYKRILTYKLYNPEYVCKFSFECILSEVKKLTLGCKKECDCFAHTFEEIEITTTTSTTTVIQEGIFTFEFDDTFN